MSKTWIVVGNGSQARIYERNKGLALVAQFEHPESRMKRAELVTDRPGHMQSVGNGHGARQFPTDPKEHEIEVFAIEIAKFLDHSRSLNKFDRLVLVASNSFLRFLKQHLPNGTAGLLWETIEKDYTKAADKEIMELLSKQLPL